MNKYLQIIRQSLVTLKPFEVFLLTMIIALSVVSFAVKDSFGLNDGIACVSAILGVFCVVLGAKGSMANWLFGIVECVLYAYIALSGHIYGDALQRIFYTLPMQFVGWHLWSKRKLNNDAAQIRTRYMSWGVRGLYLLITVLLVIALGLFLQFISPLLTDFLHSLHFKVASDYTSDFQLWLDATTTILFLVTMFISTKAYVEQWYIWLIINIFSIIIWALMPKESEFKFMTVAKYSVYLVNSFYGLYMWNRLSRA